MVLGAVPRTLFMDVSIIAYFFYFVSLFNKFLKIASSTLTTIPFPACLYNCVLLIPVAVLSLVVMALNSANGRLLLDISERFFRLILISYLINVFAIIIYCVGEKLVVHTTNRVKK